MKKTSDTDIQNIKNRGWQVTFAGMGINLALGILYTWSVISKGIPAEWGWSEAEKSWPYGVACFIFSLIMVPAGRLQDKFGPSLVLALGGFLVGIGMIITSFTTSPIGFIVGFGIIAGTGIGFGYAATTPPAVKWFPASRTGLVTGLVVAGFGLASVYAAPLAKYLIVTYGLQTTLFLLGAAFMVVVIILAQLVKSPPAGFKPVEIKNTSSGSAAVTVTARDYSPVEMLKTPQFYMLWFMYACGAGAGLMVIAKLAAIAKIQASIELGFILVAVLAIGNGGGRVVAGMLSDKFGRQHTMFVFFVCQAALIYLLSTTTAESILANVVVLSLMSACIGACYGANLSLFPSITKDFYGLKNFGVNYGLVFTAWGAGGFMLALVAGKLYDIYQSFSYAYYGAISLLIIAALTTFMVREPGVSRHFVPKEAIG